MFFRISPCVGLVTPDLDKASRFYRDSMHMTLESFEEGMEFLAGPLHLFLDPGPKGSIIFELLTPDLEAAQGKLKFYGFDVITWKGIGKANLVRDPFGLVFNVFEYGEDDQIDLNAEGDSMFRPLIGAVAPTIAPMAEFYSMVLQQPANKLADGSYIVSGGEVSIRFRSSEHEGPVIWLAHGTDVDGMVASGCKKLEGDENLLIDPFGVCWTVEPRSESTHAVVNPI